MGPEWYDKPVIAEDQGELRQHELAEVRLGRIQRAEVYGAILEFPPTSHGLAGECHVHRRGMDHLRLSEQSPLALERERVPIHAPVTIRRGVNRTGHTRAEIR